MEEKWFESSSCRVGLSYRRTQCTLHFVPCVIAQKPNHTHCQAAIHTLDQYWVNIDVMLRQYILFAGSGKPSHLCWCSTMRLVSIDEKCVWNSLYKHDKLAWIWSLCFKLFKFGANNYYNWRTLTFIVKETCIFQIQMINGKHDKRKSIFSIICHYLKL